LEVKQKRGSWFHRAGLDPDAVRSVGLIFSAPASGGEEQWDAVRGMGYTRWRELVLRLRQSSVNYDVQHYSYYVSYD